MDWEKENIVSLPALLDWIKQENRKTKERKRFRSHTLASGFLYTLKDWTTPIEEPRGNANYFCVKLDDIKFAVTPFASHDEWWDKPSQGFRQMVARHGASWGVVFFDLPKGEGLWIEGKDFDESLLKGREKVSASLVRHGKKLGILHPFSEIEQFIELIRNPPRKPGKPFLISRKKRC